MAIASLALALLAAVATGLGVWKLYRIGSESYGVSVPPGSHPARLVRASRDEQSASDVAVTLHEYEGVAA